MNNEKYKCESCCELKEEDELIEVLLRGTRKYLFVCAECAENDETFTIIL